MQTTISDLIGGENRQIISQGNHLPDKEIEDALPLWSLTLIEGENNTGKSVLTRQITDGAMEQGAPVDLFTAGNTTRNCIRKKGSMSLYFSKYFILGYHRVFPLHVVGFKWNKAEIENILRRLIAGIWLSTAQVAII